MVNKMPKKKNKRKGGKVRNQQMQKWIDNQNLKTTKPITMEDLVSMIDFMTK